MLTIPTFNHLVFAWIALALILVPFQLFVTAPYGRHVRGGWGVTIPNRLGWFAMEIVSPLVFGGLFLFGPSSKTAPMWIFLALWCAHYINRSLIFPLRIKTGGKRMPVAIALGAVAFNIGNGGLNGYYLGWLAHYPDHWLADPRFIMGVALFAIGGTINLWADNRLIALRSARVDYAIPRGGLFEWISCPNLFGEIVEWAGFALACWSLSALSFAIWTAANLVPRALSHHRWYRAHFADYPKGRRAVIPGVL